MKKLCSKDPKKFTFTPPNPKNVTAILVKGLIVLPFAMLAWDYYQSRNI